MKLKINYKKGSRVSCLVLLFLLPLLCWGKDFNALYNTGNQQYKKAQYQEAIKSYQQIVSGGYQSDKVYFNLGNAYFKLGDIPSALLYYEKAHKLAPGDEDINFNIYFANSKTADKVEPRPEFFVTQWWHSFILYLPISTLTIWSVLFLIAGSGLLVLYLFTAILPVKKLSFYCGILLIFLGLLSVFVANRQAHYFNDHQQAIIFSGSVNVKSGPDDSSSTLFVLHDGTKVNILDENDDWMKIQLANGNVGWIQQADVREI
jgi:tetratricopeptide (TPR) repeat protein